MSAKGLMRWGVCALLVAIVGCSPVQIAEDPDVDAGEPVPSAANIENPDTKEPPSPVQYQTTVAAPDRKPVGNPAVEPNLLPGTPPAMDPQRNALFALFESTDGANWKNNDNWLSDAPLEQWYGVVLNAAGRVIKLNLKSNGLNGEIPVELGQLADLRRLSLYGNTLVGQIPPSLGNLSNLEHLDLGKNQLRGQIPPSLGNLSNLQFLYLANNQLRGQIPITFGALSYAITVNIHPNDLSGCIPFNFRRVARSDHAEFGLPYCPAPPGIFGMRLVPDSHWREAYEFFNIYEVACIRANIDAELLAKVLEQPINDNLQTEPWFNSIVNCLYPDTAASLYFSLAIAFTYDRSREFVEVVSPCLQDSLLGTNVASMLGNRHNESNRDRAAIERQFWDKLTDCMEMEPKPDPNYHAPRADVKFTTVDAGVDHTCGIVTNGLIECWGDNRDGQATPPDGEFVAVSAGSSHTCGVRTGGQIDCWGSNYSGKASPPDGEFVDLSAGVIHTCGVTASGHLACWGSDEGWGPWVPEGEFVAVSAGLNFTCGIKADGSIACSGDNLDGQATPPDGEFVAISAGWHHTCAIKRDGLVACWGADFLGEALPPDGAFVDLSAGVIHTCGVTASGQLACWGANKSGQTWPTPGELIPVTGAFGHTCVLQRGGSYRCFLSNPLNLRFTSTHGFVSVSSGDAYSCGLMADGSLTCWGDYPLR